MKIHRSMIPKPLSTKVVQNDRSRMELTQNAS
jgi:hypothetical protein